ncbi:MAG: PD40 domain-containing protein [Chloroflexi bacterium]|nr:PD40 domain-containing protein [Chloroflexota bacterium]
MGAALPGLLLSLALMACGAMGVPGLPATPSAATTPASSLSGVPGRIAYVSEDYRLTIMDAGGRAWQPAPGASAYQTYQTWPVWSPLGDAVAFSVFSNDAFTPGGAIQVVQADRRQVGSARLLFQDAPGAGPALGLAAPHYLQWSPDGAKIAFLAAGGDALSLYVASRAGGEGPRLVAQGAPLSFAWSPDSQSLLVHRGSELLRADLSGSQRVMTLEARSQDYRAPSWSPEAQSIAYLASTRGGNRLTISRQDGSGRLPLAPVTGMAAFLWSPDGRRLALGQSLEARDPLMQAIEVLEVATGRSTPVFRGPAIAFFWSPDGRKLAYVTASNPSALQWRTLDLESGADISLAEFLPSGEELTLLASFDLHAASHTPWSADGRWLLFAGSLVQQGDAPALDIPADGVYILDVTGQEPPRRVARGLLAAWSPEANS